MKVNKASTLKYLKNAPAYQLEMIQQGHEINLVKLGRSKIYLFFTDEAVQKVLLTHASHFHKGMALQNTKDLIGENILNSDGQTHLTKRKLLSKVFSKAYINKFESQINQHIDSRFENIVEIETSAEQFFTSLAMDIISIMLFGKPLKDEIEIIDRCLASSLKMIALFTVPGYKKLLPLPLPHHKRYHQGVKDLNQVTMDLISSRKQQDFHNQGAIDILINEGCSDSEIKSQVMALFLAGHETTATSLTWMLYQVLLTPEILDTELLEEIRECDSKNITYQEIENYPRFKAFLWEVLRLYPPVWNVGRKIVKDLEISGVSLKAGDYLTLSPYTVQRNPKIYSNPEEFNYHRWLEADSFKAPDKFHYFPFSHGARNCIGKILAETELFTVAKKLFSRFNFELLSKPDVKPKGLITLKPDREIRIKIRKQV